MWEDKLGLLQAGLEDANLKIAHLQGRYDERNTQCESLADDVHTLERTLEEEKSAHLLTARRLEDSRQQASDLTSTLHETQQTVELLKGELQGALVDKANAESARERAEHDARDLLAHRNEILSKMQESVAQQEQAAYNWQRAEVAAAIAESQRNFALADRDRYQKRHGAVLGELATATVRLADAESELMELKTDLAEYIYEFTRAKRSQKRATKALEAVAVSRSKPTQEDGSRAATAPAPASLTTASRSIRPQNAKKLAPASLIAEVTAGQHPELAVTHGIVYPKKHKKHFSLAAREFGDRLRAEEQKKQQLRVRELQRVENQFLADGLRVRIAEADHFQEEFVSTVRAFSTARAGHWKQLKRERDHQLRFANDALDRNISTAPAGVTSTGLVDHGASASPAQATAELESADKLSSSSMPDLNYQVYGKYAGSASHRPITSPHETRLQASFFSVDAAGELDRLRASLDAPKSRFSSNLSEGKPSELVSLPLV